MLDQLSQARSLLLDNIMPDHVAVSAMKRVYWIAKRVACTNQVVASFKRMNEQLLQQMAGLGVSINVAVSSRLQQSFNHSEQVSTEVAELRRYITQQQQQAGSDETDTLYSILEAVESRDHSAELASLLHAKTASGELLQQVRRRLDVLEGLSAPQVQQLQRIAAQWEGKMREAGEWSQQLRDSMARWEAQLEQQTAAVIGRIDEMDDRRSRAEAELKQLLACSLHQGDVHSRQLLLVMQMLRQALPGMSGKVVDGVQAAVPSAASRSSRVREFTLDAVQVQFDDESLLGEGAGGKIYWGRLEGVLPAGRDEIAFKRLAVSAPSRSNSSSSSLTGRGRGCGLGPTATTIRASRTTGGPSRSSPGGADPLVLMLRREAKVAWRLNGSPHCVKLHGICLQPPALIYEYCNWSTLTKLLYQQAWDEDAEAMQWAPVQLLSLEDKVSCVDQLLQGLYFLHSKGIVHRDLKSANVLIHNLSADDEQPVLVYKLADYGSARGIVNFVHSVAFSTLADGKQHGGTSRWLAPERRAVTDDPDRKRVEGDPAVDVYALGCVIGEVFTQLPPFATCREQDVWRQPVDAAPFKPEQLPEPIRQLLSACCHPRADCRPRVQELLYSLWPRGRSALSAGSTSLLPVSVVSPPVAVGERPPSLPSRPSAASPAPKLAADEVDDSSGPAVFFPAQDATLLTALYTQESGVLYDIPNLQIAFTLNVQENNRTARVVLHLLNRLPRSPSEDRTCKERRAAHRCPARVGRGLGDPTEAAVLSPPHAHLHAGFRAASRHLSVVRLPRQAPLADRAPARHHRPLLCGPAAGGQRLHEFVGAFRQRGAADAQGRPAAHRRHTRTAGVGRPAPQHGARTGEKYQQLFPAGRHAALHERGRQPRHHAYPAEAGDKDGHVPCHRALLSPLGECGGSAGFGPRHWLRGGQRRRSRQPASAQEQCARPTSANSYARHGNRPVRPFRGLFQVIVSSVALLNLNLNLHHVSTGPLTPLSPARCRPLLPRCLASTS